jgi:RNase adaptor protein for sRNA GlmZ degradation
MTQPLILHVFSFGYKFTGPPLDESGHGGGFVFDCRALPNPFWDEAVRAYSGVEPPVAAWLDKEAEVREFADLAAKLVLYTARTYAKLGRERLQVAFGCTGGRHRSPYLAEALRRTLEAEGFRVVLRHLDIEHEAGRFADDRK